MVGAGCPTPGFQEPGVVRGDVGEYMSGKGSDIPADGKMAYRNFLFVSPIFFFLVSLFLFQFFFFFFLDFFYISYASVAKATEGFYGGVRGYARRARG